VNVVDGVKAAALLFLAAIMQVSIFAQVHVLGGVPDVLLVMLVAVALLRGAIVGACGGFFAGLLVDTASLGRLGLTSLVLTIAGYWIGRYGETTGRDRAHAPFLSVAVVTILYSLGLLLVQMTVGEIQYRTKLPWWLVLGHVTLAAAVWASAVAFVGSLWRSRA